MPEVYSLSGAADEQPADLFNRLKANYKPPGGPLTPLDRTCAEQVKIPVIMAGAARIGSVGVGLFGTYKLLKGRGAAGITAILGGGALWLLSSALLSAAERSFDECRRVV